MAIPFLVAAGMGLAKGALDAYGADQKRKTQNRAIQGQIKGLQNLANVTPAERDYVQRRRKIIAEGDPMIKEQFNRATGAIRQQGSFNRQRAQGQAIQQGLENSIVAQELRRKVDKDVLDSVSQQAQQMAMANRQAKRQAEGELEGMNLKTDARKAQTTSQIAGLEGQKQDYDRWGTLANVAMQGISAGVGQHYSNVAAADKAAAEQNRWEREMEFEYGENWTSYDPG
tara:strand:+ start:10910 stop:11593 length:684 start_codon:yes stop_codon:yes gene_type:complete